MDKPSVNRRIFPRYRVNIDCGLLINGKRYSAMIVDYSVGGIGILLKDIQPLPAEIFSIRVDSVDYNAGARVAWREDLFSGKRVGLEKLSPFIGSLQKYRLADILMGMHKQGKTGVLEISGEEINKRIFFENGKVIFSASDEPHERMGDMLLEAGKITKEDYDKSVQIMAETGKRQGTALVEIGSLSPADLIWAVRYQVEQIIMNLFHLQNASFAFREAPVPLDEVVTLNLSTGNLVYKGMKHVRDIDYLRSQLPPFEKTVQLAQGWRNICRDIPFTGEEERILALFNGTRTLGDVIADSPLKEEETVRVILGLESLQIFTDEFQLDAGSTETACKEDDADVDPVFAGRLEKLYRDHKSLGYFGILNVPRSASTDDIKRSYRALAKEFHPDRHRQLRSDDLQAKLHTVFSYINEAYQTLSRKGASAGGGTGPSEPVDHREKAARKFSEGRGHLNTYDYAEAEVAFGQALYLDDSIPKYHYFHGIALWKNRKMKQAEEAIMRASRLEPSNTEYIYSLGEIYRNLGFTTRARNTFTRVLKMDPSHEKATRSLRDLDAEQ